MENNITLGVYRRTYDPPAGVPGDQAKDLELHNLRKEALHEVLDNQQIAQVYDWGFANDSRPHEFVEIFLGGMVTTVITPMIIAGLKELGTKLGEKAIDEATSAFVKWIISKLIKKQKEKKISDFSIKLNDGTFLKIDPPDRTSEITISFANGEVASVRYQIDNG